MKRLLNLLNKQSLTLVVVFFFVLEIAVFAQIFVVFKVTDFLAAVLPGTLVSLTNEERADASVGALTVNPLLEQAAKMKANDMAEKGYFAHTSPEGVEPWYWLRQVGYTYVFAGENLAVNFTESEDVSKAWMNSPAHRKNIENGNYTEIGIATAEGMYKGKQSTFVVQYFGRPVASSVPTNNPVLVDKPAKAPAPAPTKAPTPTTNTKPVVVSDNTPTNNQPVVTVVPSPQVEGEESIIRHTITKITSSPRLYANYIIGLLVTLLLCLLFLAIMVKRHIQHPKMIAATLAVAILGMGLITFNNAILNGNIELPSDSNTASTFMAF